MIVDSLEANLSHVYNAYARQANYIAEDNGLQPHLSQLKRDLHDLIDNYFAQFHSQGNNEQEWQKYINRLEHLKQTNNCLQELILYYSEQQQESTSQQLKYQINLEAFEAIRYDLDHLVFNPRETAQFADYPSPPPPLYEERPPRFYDERPPPFYNERPPSRVIAPPAQFVNFRPPPSRIIEQPFTLRQMEEPPREIIRERIIEVPVEVPRRKKNKKQKKAKQEYVIQGYGTPTRMVYQTAPQMVQAPQMIQAPQMMGVPQVIQQPVQYAVQQQPVQQNVQYTTIPAQQQMVLQSPINYSPPRYAVPVVRQFSPQTVASQYPVTTSNVTPVGGIYNSVQVGQNHQYLHPNSNPTFSNNRFE